MKNQNFNKEEYKVLKQFAKNIAIAVSARKNSSLDWANTYNGVSIAFHTMSGGPDTRMLAVAVSYCAPEDEFKKKVGKYQALIKIANGEYVQLPLAQYYYDCGEEETMELLHSMFGRV